ncbi:MAG: hypothetical protein HC848_04020 [Limnobacter sp.]|nr:hypothetical protein [Limnobacter sp.]
MKKAQSALTVWWPAEQEITQAEEAGKIPRVRFSVQGTNGQILHRGHEALNLLPGNLPCLVLLHPLEVGHLRLTLPPISGRKLRDAIPFLAEPQLMNDPEENLFALHPNYLKSSASQDALVTVVSKQTLRRLAALCRQHGLQPAAVSCETLRQTAATVLWITGETLVLGSPSEPPLALPLKAARAMAALCKKRAELPGTNPGKNAGQAAGHAVVFTPEDDLPKLQGLGFSGLQVASNHVAPVQSLLDRPVCSADELRKLGVKVDRSSVGDLSKLLWPAAVLGITALAGVNALAFKVAQTQFSIEQTIAQTYHEALPDVPMVADPLLLLQREKKALNAGMQVTPGEGVSFLLHEAGQALDNAPFNSLNSLHWNGQTLSLVFNSSVQAATQEEALARLKGRPVQARWLSAAGTPGPVLEISAKAGT